MNFSRTKPEYLHTEHSKQLPIITLVLPVWNANKHYLEQLFSSLSIQSINKDKWMLHILLDGLQETITINELHAMTSKIKNVKISQCKRLGLKNILNYGLNECTTMYFSRIDADDIAHPNRLEAQLAAFENDSRLSVLGCKTVYIDNKSCEINTNPLFTYPASDLLIRLLGALYNNPLSHPTIMAKTIILKNLGGYTQNSPYEDYDLWSRLPSSCKIQNLNRKLMYYRIHSTQITNKEATSYMTILMIRMQFAKNLFKKYPYLVSISPFILLVMLIPIHFVRLAVCIFKKIS
jgi:glycosyltransferase involved in cell wall biosynthesis